MDDINRFGHWAEGDLTFMDHVGLEEALTIQTGRSTHAIDGSHKNFGCNSTVGRLMELLDQSGAPTVGD